ncbi:MAG: EamA family transporter [Dehalococcoidales bacterium]|nr:EamA family transporter [Dehalococcoidales bacterium]
MVWITAALANAVIMSFISIVDSHMLTRRMPSLRAYLLPVGLTHLIISFTLLAVFRLPDNSGVIPVLVAIVAGLLNGLGGLLVLTIMRYGEVSRVIPVVSSAPIFVALLSVPLLGEMVGYREWLGILLAVTGAMLISVHLDGSGRKVKLQKSFFLLVLASLSYAASNIGFKYTLGTLSFWNVYSFNAICVGAIFFLYSLRRTTIGELRTLKKRTQTLALTVGNQCIVTTGMVLSFVALDNGPVSLASTIMNIRPAIVFLFAVILSRFYPAVLNERLEKRTVLVKLIAITLITCGVVLITLFN